MDDFTTRQETGGRRALLDLEREGAKPMADPIQSPYTESQLRQYDAIEGALKDSADFALLWHALDEYRLAAIRRESVQPIEEHGVMFHLASKIEHNAKLCLEMAVDLHASLVTFAVQKALLDLEREVA